MEPAVKPTPLANTLSGLPSGTWSDLRVIQNHGGGLRFNKTGASHTPGGRRLLRFQGFFHIPHQIRHSLGQPQDLQVRYLRTSTAPPVQMVHVHEMSGSSILQHRMSRSPQAGALLLHAPRMDKRHPATTRCGQGAGFFIFYFNFQRRQTQGTCIQQGPLRTRIRPAQGLHPRPIQRKPIQRKPIHGDWQLQGQRQRPNQSRGQLLFLSSKRSLHQQWM